MGIVVLDIVLLTVIASLPVAPNAAGVSHVHNAASHRGIVDSHGDTGASRWDVYPQARHLPGSRHGGVCRSGSQSSVLWRWLS